MITLGWQAEHYLWVVTPENLSRWDVNDGTHTTFYKANDILFISPSNWICFEAGAAPVCYDGKTWHEFSPPNTTFGQTTFAALPINENIWVGSAGLIKYDLNTEVWTTIIPPLSSLTTPNPYEVQVEGFYALLQTKDEALWAGTSQGVVRLDATGTQWWHEADGLSSDVITALLQAQDGRIWVRTSNGLDAWDGKYWVTFSNFDPNFDPDGRRSRLLLEAPNGDIWTAVTKGVARWDGIAWKIWDEDNGLADWRVQAMLSAANGDIWVGTYAGLSVWDGKSWHTFTVADGLKSNEVRALVEDAQGNIWVGGPNGIVYFDIGNRRWKAFPDKP